MRRERQTGRGGKPGAWYKSLKGEAHDVLSAHGIWMCMRLG